MDKLKREADIIDIGQLFQRKAPALLPIVALH